MNPGVKTLRSIDFNADLSRIFVVTLAMSLAASLLCASTIASTALKGAPRSNDFSRSATEFDSRLSTPRSNDFSRSASEFDSHSNGPRTNDFSRSAFKSDPSYPPSIADEWDEVFDTARSVLAKLPDPSRIETTIKDPALRQAVLRAYQSLKACAKVSRAQNHATKVGMLADFERDFKSVRTEAERGEYQSCAATCSTEGTKCEKDCQAAHKKLCACKITEFGSFVTKCIFG